MKLYDRYVRGALLWVITCFVAACGADKDAKLQREYEAKAAEYSILQNLQQEPAFSIVLDLIDAAGLAEILDDETQTLTLFAPQNSAFSGFTTEELLALSSNQEALTTILLHHVVLGEEYNAYGILGSAGNTITSAAGPQLFVNRELQQAFVNGTAISQADIKSTNGVVHQIDSVLLPPDLGSRSVEDVKADIVALARQYTGVEDADFTIQREFEPLLAELLSLVEMNSIAERLELIAQPWQQVWGPYSYGSGQQGVDPDFAPEEVYQVVFADGYYYNVTPLIDVDSGAEQIGLLRGEFSFDDVDDQCLNVRFQKFPGVTGRPQGIDLWSLPALEESGDLESETGLERVEIVPSWVVSSFFGGGQLCEIYTDDTLRISISTEDDNQERNQLYILEKVSM